MRGQIGLSAQRGMMPGFIGEVMKFVRIALLVAGLSLFSSNAMAQQSGEACRNLDGNSEWNELLQKMQRFHEKGLYLDALDVAQKMTKICSKSPMLNYYIAIEYQGLKENVKALSYLQRASDYISDFVVSPEVSKEIWYARYEAEFPSHTQANIDRMNSEIEELNEKVQILEKDNSAGQMVSNEIVKNSQQSYFRDKDYLYRLMWTGIGVGIGGAVAGIGGAVLLGIYHDEREARYVLSDKTDKHPKEMRIMNKLGWGLIGGGGALLISGAIVGGLAGTWYKQLSDEDALSVTFQASPGYFGVAGEF